MQRCREVAERARGHMTPRRSRSTGAVVLFRPILNAPAYQELLKVEGGVDIVVWEIRATQHVIRKCEESGIETIDVRMLRLAGGADAYIPRHELLATAQNADAWMCRNLPHIKKEQLPRLGVTDAGGRYYGVETGEIWQCDPVSDGKGVLPPRLVTN